MINKDHFKTFVNDREILHIYMHMNLDTVVINNLALQAHIGCSIEEQQNSQPISISLKLGIETWCNNCDEKILSNKDLSKTVCYAAVANETVALAQKKSWFLVEELASNIIDNIFNNHSTVKSIYIEVKKFALPNVEWAGVCMQRYREL